MAASQCGLMMPSSVTATGATTVGASPATASCANQGRSRNTATKVARYMASGITQRNGAAATSVVTNEVTAMTSPDGTAASAVQRIRSAAVGGASAGVATRAPALARRATMRPAVATSSASPANANDHRRAWACSGTSGSITNG